MRHVFSQFCRDFSKSCFRSELSFFTISVFKIIVIFKNPPKSIFYFQVTEKTRADVKGGTLINYGGKLRLLEVAQVYNNRVYFDIK